MSEDNTIPPVKQNWWHRIKRATAVADPVVDKGLDAAKASMNTPWIIVAVVIICVLLTAWAIK